MIMSSSPSRINLYFAACGANLATFAIGNGYTWTSPSLPKLEAPDSWLHLQGNEASWIGSLHSLGAAFGPFLGGYLASRLGRKWTCNIAIIIEIVSWMILLLANSVYEIYVSRFVLGIGGGIVFTAIPMYVGEIAEDSVRGALGTLLAFFVCAGFLLVYCIGPYVSYDILIYCSLIAPVIFIIVFTFLPESPYYLLQKDKKSEALASLAWLRKGRTPDDIEKELNMMQSSVVEDMKNAGHLSDLVSTSGNRFALLLSCGGAAFQQLSGVNAVLFYSQSIFDMAGTSFSSSISAIIVGTMLVIGAAAAAPFAKHYAIKHLFIVSAVGMTLFHGILGVYFYLLEHGHDVTSLWWLPVVSLVGYIGLYAIGFGPLPWALMGEVFPSNVKPIASAVTTSLCWGLSFIVTRYFNSVSELLGTYFSFWLFAVFCIIAFLYSVFLVPNTKGKSLQEIQDILNKRTKN